MITLTFKQQLENAHNLKFDFEDNGYFTDLEIECEDFAIVFDADVVVLNNSFSGSYTDAPEFDSETRISIAGADMFNNDGEEIEITKEQIKYLEILLNKKNQ